MLANWVMQEINSTGIGDISLGTALQGYIPANDKLVNGDKVFYTVESGYDKETGIGQYVSSGNKIIREQILETLVAGVFSNSTPSPISISAGAVFFVSGSVQGLTTNTLVWKELPADLIVPPSTSVLVPDFKQFVVNVSAFHFNPAISEELGLRLTINNDIAVGTTLYPSIRWSPKDNTTGIVRWGITLATAELNGTFSDAGVIYLEQSGGGTTNAHQQIEFSASAILAPNPNTLIIGKVFRDSAHVNDTYTGDAVLHSVSLGYQSDRVGTPKKNQDHYQWN